MALALNTSHPLYADLDALFCVDDDNVIKDLTGNNTCTPHANVTLGTATYGRHFRTFLVSNNAQGIAISPGILAKPTANPVGTVFVVINAGNSRASRGSILEIGGNRVNAAVYTGDVVGIMTGTANPSLLGTTDLIGTGAHSLGAAWNGITGQLGQKTFADGAVQNSAATNIGNASAADYMRYLGGTDTGGFGGFAADYVWVAHFNRYLSDAEIADLHASLGASNAFGLVESAPTGVTITGNLGTATASGFAAAIAVSVTIACSLGGATASGHQASIATSSNVTINASLGTAAASGYSASVVSAGSATITTDVFKNNTGTVLASTVIPKLAAIKLSDMTLAASWTNQATNGSGVLSLTDAMTAATDYLLVVSSADGASVGVKKYTAT